MSYKCALAISCNSNVDQTGYFGQCVLLVADVGHIQYSFGCESSSSLYKYRRGVGGMYEPSFLPDKKIPCFAPQLCDKAIITQ